MDWIDWIQKHLFTLVIIAGVLGQLFKAIRGQKDEDADTPAAPPAEKSFEDSEADERARRIREDIQRKIAQRRREEAGEPVAAEPQPSAYDEPPPLMRDETEAPPPVVTRSIITERAPEAAAALQRMETQRQAEILEQQAALADKMRELEQMKAAAQRRAAFEAASVNPQEVARTAARGALLDDLRDPTALRRAFVLREVLGPPVALR